MPRDIRLEALAPVVGENDARLRLEPLLLLEFAVRLHRALKAALRSGKERRESMLRQQKRDSRDIIDAA